MSLQNCGKDSNTNSSFGTNDTLTGDGNMENQTNLKIAQLEVQLAIHIF
jgi:hypothetical protein